MSDRTGSLAIVWGVDIWEWVMYPVNYVVAHQTYAVQFAIVGMVIALFLLFRARK